MQNNNKTKLDVKLMFWIGILVIGVGALITGAVLLAKDKNNLMWLIIGFGIILILAGLLFTISLILLKKNQKQVRENLKNKGI